MITNFVFEHGWCSEKADEGEVPRASPLVRFIGCITIPGTTALYKIGVHAYFSGL
jgi:hypothetical protein